MTTALILCIGESGMVGQGDLTHDMPAGYPGNTARTFGKDYKWRLLREPTHANPVVAPTPAEPQIVEAVQPAISSCGVMAWKLGLLTGKNIAILPCARNGTFSTDWVAGGTLYNTAVRRVQTALQTPGTYLAAVYHEQGINNANQSLQAQWLSDWLAIETQLRADLGFSGPWCFVQQHVTPWTNLTGGGEPARWTTLRAQIASFAGPNKYMVTKPEGPWNADGYALHLATSAQVVLGLNAAAVLAPVLP